MKLAGRPLGIDFDYEVLINRQPIDSQRMLLWAARHGKQEEYVSALSRKHFTQGSAGESASKAHTVLAAAKEAGLDEDAAASFLRSGELRDVVWRSYGDMPRRGISAIPLFVFNVPELGVEGGPLRPHAASSEKPPIVNGSMTPELFEEIFDDLYDRVAVLRRRRGAGAHRSPPPAAAAPAAPAPLEGRRVVLRGLASRPDLNGRAGKCGRHDAAKGRYAVRLDGSTERLSIRGANLEEVKEEEVVVEEEDEEEVCMF